MDRTTVLVVDDEPRMREMIRLYLQSRFDVLEASDGVAALALMKRAHPNIILLDVMMPKMDGWETLRNIRSQSTSPVIMLTARGDVGDRIQGLGMGADDYITKPFDGRELAARIDAVLRRTTSASEGMTMIRRGNLAIHPGQRVATWKGKPVPLTPKEFDLLTFLAAHPGHAFTRERLLDRIWGPEYEGETRTVDSHVKNVREKLGDGAACLVTVWRVGYRFVEDNHAKH